MTRISLDEIGYDPRYYPRANGNEDWLTVHRYRDALASDPRKEFPAICVVRVHGKPYRYLILDGLHRLKAYALAKRETIQAVIERLTESKWFARSVELNATHGRTLDTGDKAWAAKRLEEDGYTIEQAAELLQMRVESLEKIKAEHATKIKTSAGKAVPVGRSNREIGGEHWGFLKSPFKDMAGTATAQEALKVQGPVASMNVLNVLDSAIAVLSCGVDMANEDIALRIEKIRALLPTPMLN